VVIRQFDVFPNPSRRSREDAPYVVVLQSQYAGDLPTLVVAPVYRAEVAERLTKLSVDVRFDGQDLVILLPELVAIKAAMLRSRSADFLSYEDNIRAALNRLFTGF
jgi:toxin CcdB